LVSGTTDFLEPDRNSIFEGSGVAVFRLIGSGVFFPGESNLAETVLTGAFTGSLLAFGVTSCLGEYSFLGVAFFGDLAIYVFLILGTCFGWTGVVVLSANYFLDTPLSPRENGWTAGEDFFSKFTNPKPNLGLLPIS